MILLIRRIRGRPRDHIFSDPPTEGLLSQGEAEIFARTGRELRSGGVWRGSASSMANNPSWRAAALDRFVATLLAMTATKR